MKECSGPDEVEALQREIEQVGEFDEELETVIERLREQAPLDFGDSEDEGEEAADLAEENAAMVAEIEALEAEMQEMDQQNAQLQ